jgi:hypothetical protein
VRNAHLRPALEDVLPVGIRGGRQNRDAWPLATGGGKQRPVEVEHGREELPRADERYRAAHRAESSEQFAGPVAGLAAAPTTLRHCADLAQVDPTPHDRRAAAEVV